MSRSQIPRATIHKQILDVAESKPDASFKTIATEVSCASVDLVDKVLVEYGDPSEISNPGDDSPDKSGEVRDHTMSGEVQDHTMSGEVQSNVHHDETEIPAEAVAVNEEQVSAVGEELTEEQMETLRVIHEHPEASQRELADLLEISQSTVNHRLNAITGFEWEHRREFCTEVFRGEERSASSPSSEPVPDSPGRASTTEILDEGAGQDVPTSAIEEQLEELTGHIDAMRRNLVEATAENDGGSESGLPFDDPD